MSSVLTDTPFKHTPATNLNTLTNEETNFNENYTKRKIEFDKGNPLSFNYCSNQVDTIPYTAKGLGVFIWKKMLNSPFNIIIILLMLFYIIVLSVNMEEIKALKLGHSIAFHLLILVVELVLTIWEYFSIYLNDRKTNNQPVKVYNSEKKVFVASRWKEIQVGQIIRVDKDEVVPVDIIILESIDSNHQCYLDYSAIDGLFDSFVLKRACNDTQGPSMKKIKFHEYVKNIKGVLKYEEPNSNIYSFNGKLKLESFPRASDITDENFIMRGATLKNIKWIYGLVVYAGMETKIMQILRTSHSESKSIIKRDRDIMRVALIFIQYFLISLYIILFTLLLFIELHKSFLCYYSFRSPIGDDHNYLGFASMDQSDLAANDPKANDPFREMFLTFIQYVLSFHLILPFAWFGLIRIAYNLLTRFIQWDTKVLLHPKNTVEINNKNCIGDFGQVKYILTDKTGTLTERKFCLKACSVHGKLYSFDPFEKKNENYIFKVKKKDMSELEIYQELRANSQYSSLLKEFIEYLCLCHTVKVSGNNTQIIDLDDKFKNDKIYGSCYAEERSILRKMKKLGYVVKKAKDSQVHLEVNNETRILTSIAVSKYSNERKRMSILYKSSTGDNSSTLLVKANDFSIFALCKKGLSDSEIIKTKLQVKELVKYGYRVFIYCKRHLTEDETELFISKYKTAENYVMKSDEHLNKLAIEYERELDFLGVLFFEEKVTNDLKYSITKLNNNGIKIWIASGDKRQNVLAVGKNLNIYNPNTIIGDFTDKDKMDDVDMKMSTLLNQLLFPNEKINKMKTRFGVNVDAQGYKGSCKDLTLIISGGCFTRICADQWNFQSLATLLSYCTNLLAYSFSPSNKYLLCQMIKNYVSKNSKVLAIGDGFNDFMMLKEADLSIGIRSREILQVRNSCDVIVTKFPQIVELILVHGTWNFNKLVSIGLKSFYANFIIIFPMFLHQNSNLIGSAFYINSPLLLCLNIFVLNLAIIFIVCFDYPIERSIIGINANVYKENFYDKKKIVFEFGLEFIKAGADSLILYYFFFILNNPINQVGHTMEQAIVGTSIIYTSFAIILFKLLALKIKAVNYLHVIILIITIGALVGIVFVEEQVKMAVVQGLSYFPIVFNSFIIVGISYIYEYFVFALFNVISQDFIIHITKMFKEYIDTYMLFKDFRTMYLSVSKEPPKVVNKIDKITYPEVLNRLFKINKTLNQSLENMADVSNEEVANIKIHKGRLTFYERKLEDDFVLKRSKNFSLTYLCHLGSIFLYWLTDVCIEGFPSEQLITKLTKLAYIVIGLLILIPSLKKSRRTLFMIHFIISIIIEVVCVYVEKSNNDVKICIQPFFILCIPLLFPMIKFTLVLHGAFLYLLSLIPSLYLNDFGFSTVKDQQFFLYSNLPLCYHRTVFIVAIIVLLIFVSRQNEINSRVEFLKYQKCQIELRKDNLVMNNLAPEFVRAKLNAESTGAGAALGYEVVTIVFCDINDFDSLVAKLSPKDLIFSLDNLYNVFDQFCILHGLQKIETVGKTYMAAGGIKECEKDVDFDTLKTHHAIRCFEFSLDILSYIRSMLLPSGDKVVVKIGIHTGDVIPAVVGHHKPQFSLIGDTVNTTARMCSYSSENCINCSEPAHDNIKEQYKDFIVSSKFVKGKGDMNLFLFNPLKNKKTELKGRIAHDSSGNLILNSVTKKCPVLIKQNTKTSLRDVAGYTPIAATDKNNASLHKNSLIDNSIQIIENSFEELNASMLSSNNKTDRKSQKHSDKKDKELFIINAPNEFLQNSHLFISFTNPIAKNKFDRFEKQIFLSSENLSIYVNSCFLIIILIGVYEFSQYTLVSKQAIGLFIAIKSVLLLVLVGVVYQTKFVIQNYGDILRWINFLLFLAFTILLQLQMNYTDEEFLVNITIEAELTIMTITLNGMLNYIQNFINAFFYIIIFIINCAVNYKSHLILKYCIFLIASTVLSLVSLFVRYYISTLDFIQNQKEADTLQAKEKMLFNLMPLHVVQNLKDEIQVADVLDNVTMLFADIVRFTDFSACHKPVEVVQMLCELFKRFDDSTNSCSVYKVHTIGDCYVVMGFNGKVSMSERNYQEEAKNVCKMAQNMIEIIQIVRKAVNFEQLDMRIGIHTGPVIAGIIGRAVVRYDIFGSDVLLANKMESSGLPGKINISEDTKNILEKNQKLDLSFTFNKIVQVPSIGREVNCYFIN